MSPAPCLRGFLLCAGLWFACACGDPSSASRETAITVFVPSGAEDFSFADASWSLEYVFVCDSATSDDPSTGDSYTLEGALEQGHEFDLGTGGPTGVWNGFVELSPGACEAQFVLRDADGEVICSYFEPEAIESPLPPEVYFNMLCYAECPTVPLPGLETSTKTICAPVGGVIVSVEIPAGPLGIQNVRYVLTDTGERFLDGAPSVVYEGALDLVRLSTTDLGQGPVPTSVWEATAGVVVSGVPYVLELTALDTAGQPICAAETSVEVISNGIARVHVLMPCSE